MKPARAIAILALLCARPAGADSGAILAMGPAGPFEVTVVVSPPQLRVGSSEWSVLVRDLVDDTPLLDAEVEIALQPPHPRDPASEHAHGVERARALRSESANRLLYTAWLEPTSPGVWQAEIRVTGSRGAGRMRFNVPVGSAPPALARHWRAFAAPFLALALFALHQWLALSGAPPFGRRHPPENTRPTARSLRRSPEEADPSLR